VAVPLVALALAATGVALQFTPTVPVAVFGQVVEVGAVRPTLSLSGPGQANLFGEGALDTVQHFDGPVRPLIVWQRFNRNDEAGQFIQSTSVDGRRVVQTNTGEVGRALSAGWTSYFLRLILWSALAGALIYLVALGIHGLLPARTPARTRPRRLLFLGAAVVLSALVAAASTALTLVSASEQLSEVKSLSDLVGTANFAPVPQPVGVARTDVNAVVVGDSTAAGIGNAPVVKPTTEDTACRRSADSYAVQLQVLTDYRVLNLACSSATINAGLLGVQYTGGRALVPQLSTLQSVQSASVVLVSIGANDVGWADLLQLCYGLPACNDSATDSLFQSRLDAFKIQYTQLLQQLSDLPNHPQVVINLYYDPFGTSFDCPGLHDPKADAGAPAGYGFGADVGKDNQDEKIKTKVEPLRAQLNRLNTVLSQGADAFGFAAVQPRFDGHELCTAQPWVQGMSDAAPFHPTAAGELAIAAADRKLLPDLAGKPPTAAG
jgi:lysophospholipase L1-like esterase